MQYAKFLVRFAWRDLTERHVRFATCVNIATVAFVVACLIVAYGWTVGVQEVGVQELREDPLNLCLWVPRTFGGPPITRELIEGSQEGSQEKQLGLAEKIRQRVGPEKLVGCYVFATSDTLRWHHRSENRAIPIDGRTVEPDDPVLNSLPLRSGKRRQLTSQDEGVIVSRPMLTMLGYGPDEVPETIKLEPPSGGEREIPVLDVVEPPSLPRPAGGSRPAQGAAAPPGTASSLAPPAIPLGHEFLIAVAYEDRLRQENLDQPCAEITVAGIPPEWPTRWDEFPESVQRQFKAHGIEEPYIDRRADGVVWTLTWDLIKQKPTLRLWKKYVEAIQQKFAECPNPQEPGKRYPAAKHLRAVAPPQQSKRIEARTYFDWLGVYLADVDALTPADQILREAGLESRNQTVIQRLLNFQNQTRMALKILAVVGIMIVLLVVWNMFVIEYLRNKQKVPEFGMLKAMGMSRWSLVAVAGCEATILGTLGLAVGVLVGCAIGLAGAWYEYGGARVTLGFAWSWYVFALGVLLAALICLGGSVLATYRAHVSPPCEALRGLINRPPFWKQRNRKNA